MVSTHALVRHAEWADTSGTARLATVRATRQDMTLHFGEPAKVVCFDDKVTHGWYFQTARGPAFVRDYWWNAPDEYSLAATNRKTARLMKRYLGQYGVRVE